MNYNKGCYRRPNADSFHRSCPPFDRQIKNSCCHDTDSYDIANTAETNYRLAMVYSPYQEWQNIYCGEKALENGTIFAELDKPFVGYKCGKGGCSL